MKTKRFESRFFGTTSLIVKEALQDAVIFINNNLGAKEYRFACAHVLGHFVDRVNVAKSYDFSFRDSVDKKYDIHEYFADEFARALLMPAYARLISVE